MIEKLLEYQEKEKQAITLRAQVEGGRVKREIDTSNKVLDDARAQLLVLEEDAKNLTEAYKSAADALEDVLDKSDKLLKQAEPKNEDEIQSTAALSAALIQKVTQYENQLDSLAKAIANKNRQFEDAKSAVVKAQTTIKALVPQFEAQMTQIRPRLEEIEKELQRIATGIDKALLEKYKNRRRTEPAGRASEIVVSLNSNRCGSCNFEIPLALVHKISTDGYIVCEECGKIIYKKG
jgi:predicted  nucleic acid-binding Zn-ribbon protein